MINNVTATVRAHEMIRQGDRVLAAVSGGADSVALLFFLKEYCEKFDGILAGALHLNHRLRGAESRRDEEFVRDLCGRWGIPLTIRSVDVAAVAAQRKLGLEEAGRECRYRFFQEQARQQHAKVATAHTLSDSAETLLLNLTRGASLRGLCGIPPVRGPYIRPLLDCTRRQVEEFLRERGLDWVEDSSNAGDEFARNRVRRHLMPLLEAENPRFLRGVGELTRQLRLDRDYLEERAREGLAAVRTPAGWSREGFLALPEALRSHALAGLLREREIPVSREGLARAAAVIQAGRSAVQLCGRWRLRCNRRQFFFEDAVSGGVEGERTISLDRVQREAVEWELGGKALKIQLHDLQKTDLFIKNPANQFKNALDCDKMGEIVTLRGRKPGDRLRLPGTEHSKSLKNLFQEAGVPPARRAQALVLAGGDGAPLWVEGLGPAAQAAVGPDTGRIAQITLVEVENAV